MGKQHSLLAWDMFWSHITEATKKCLAWNITNISVIPSSLTLMLQHLNISQNYWFKNHLCDQWNNSIMNGEKLYMKSKVCRQHHLICCAISWSHRRKRKWKQWLNPSKSVRFLTLWMALRMIFYEILMMKQKLTH